MAGFGTSTGQVWYWVDNLSYFAVSSYCITEWLRYIYYEKRLFSIQNTVILLCSVWSFLGGAVGLLSNQIKDNIVSCFPRSVISFAVFSFFPLFIYSVIVLFFIDCYVSIKLKTDSYKHVLYSAHACVNSVVILVFLINRYYQCHDPSYQDPSAGPSIEDLNLSVTIFRISYFAAGIVVFLLIRRLSTVILSAKHDIVRTRFSQVLFLYLPAFLGRFIFVLVHIWDSNFRLNNWETLLAIFFIDLLPTVAVVFSFRSRGIPESAEPIVAYYHKEDSESNWSDFNPSSPINATGNIYGYIDSYDYAEEVRQTP